MVFNMLVSCVSQRRIALVLDINRKTVIRKFLFLGFWADQLNKYARKNWPIATKVEFDELETFEHSKCKPLSVICAVESGSRRILAFQVARMPAKGPLAAIARKKYGRRKDERPAKRKLFLEELKNIVCEKALFKSDMSSNYPKDLKEHFPKAQHETFKGRRGCVVGQGELKSGGFDPLFSLNHTFAMKRANINRLVRRTWCTTKIPERLVAHISLYILYHNHFLI